MERERVFVWRKQYGACGGGSIDRRMFFGYGLGHMHESKTGTESMTYTPWHERLLRVTAALYRVTGLLPAAEPLRTMLRKHANEVLARCVGEMRGAARGSAELETKIETLLDFLVVARTLPEVKAENFLVLEREYRACITVWAREMKAYGGGERERGAERYHGSTDPALKKDAVIPERRVSELPKGKGTSERQRAILERLAQTQRVKVSDFYEIFRGISPKTIQRDLQDLVSQNVIRKEGEKRWTVYTLVGIS